jgi:hypothetical protein
VRDYLTGAAIAFIAIVVIGGAVFIGARLDDGESQSRAPNPEQPSVAPPETAPPSASTDAVAAEPPPLALGEEAKIGGTVTTENGGTGAVKVSARPTRVVDPAPNDVLTASEVQPGTRWVRVEIELKNASSSVDRYGLDDGKFSLLDDRGEEAVDNGPVGPWRYLGDSPLLPGDTRQGSLAFLVRKGHDLDELRWEPSTGEGFIQRWDLGRG